MWILADEEISFFSEPLCVVTEFAPYGDLLGFLRKKRGLKDNYYNIEHLPKRNLTSRQLMRFAWEIADGMAYLSSVKVSCAWSPPVVKYRLLNALIMQLFLWVKLMLLLCGEGIYFKLEERLNRNGRLAGARGGGWKRRCSGSALTVSNRQNRSATTVFFLWLFYSLSKNVPQISRILFLYLLFIGYSSWLSSQKYPAGWKSDM